MCEAPGILYRPRAGCIGPPRSGPGFALGRGQLGGLPMHAGTLERREPRFLTRTRVRLHVFDGSSGELTVGPIVEAESRDFGPRGLFLAGVNLACATRVH